MLKVFYPIPSIAWVPIMILWFGSTPTAIIAMVALGVFFPMLFNAEAGARAVAEVQINAARCYGASGLRLFTKVVLPSAVPFLASGLRIGIGDAWRLVIAGEIVVGQSGIGFVLNQSRFLFQTADLLTAMAVVAVVGYASEILVVRMLEKRTIEIGNPPALTFPYSYPPLARNSYQPNPEYRQERKIMTKKLLAAALAAMVVTATACGSSNTEATNPNTVPLGR